MRHEAVAAVCDMSVGTLSSYFTKRRDAASANEHEEDNHKRQQTSSVRARLEKKLQVKQKTGFAFNFKLVGDEDALEVGGPRGGGSTEREAFHFGFNLTEALLGDVGTSVSGQQHRSGGDAGPRGDDDFAVHVSGASTAPRSAKKKGKRKGGGKKKKGGKGKGNSAGNSVQYPAKNEPNRERDKATGFPTKDAAIVMPPPAVATNERCQSDGNFSPEVGNDSNEGAELRQQPGTNTLGLAQPNVGRTESSPMSVVARPPPGLTLESWTDPALTGEERRRRRFGRGVRNMAAIQRSRDARRGAGVGAADLAAEEEVVPDSSNQGGLAKPGVDRARGESSRAGGSSVFAFGFDIGISFNEGS